MGSGRSMGYGHQFSANQLGGPKNVWVMPKYGLLEVWVIGGLTVYTLCNLGYIFQQDCSRALLHM